MLNKKYHYVSQLQSMACLGEISAAHKAKFRCGSVHLVSDVHIKCALDFLVNKVEPVWLFSALSDFEKCL